MNGTGTEATGAPVSLEQMLEAREQRAARQRAALSRHHLPLVSVTLVTPGAVKDGARYRNVLTIARSSVDGLFAERGWPVCMSQVSFGPCGPEALYAVDAAPLALKRSVADLEDTHPLGRLWDLDVICPSSGQLGRRALGLAPRRCLVCNDDARACARSRRHPLADLLAVIEEKVDAYLRHSMG